MSRNPLPARFAATAVLVGLCTVLGTTGVAAAGAGGRVGGRTSGELASTGTTGTTGATAGTSSTTGSSPGSASGSSAGSSSTGTSSTGASSTGVRRHRNTGSADAGTSGSSSGGSSSGGSSSGGSSDSGAGGSSDSGAGGSSGSSGSGSGGRQSDPTCSAATLQTVQQTVGAELAARSTRLTTLGQRLAGSADVPAADAATLRTILADEATGIVDGGITGLQTDVSSTTTCAAVVGEARTMVDDFRVYALVSPQVDLTVAVSTEATVAAQLQALEPKVQAAITAAEQKGGDVTTAQAAAADLQTQVADADSALQGVSLSTLLAQVPSDYPGDASLLEGDLTAVTTAGSDLQRAAADLRQIQGDIP